MVQRILACFVMLFLSACGTATSSQLTPPSAAPAEIPTRTAPPPTIAPSDVAVLDEPTQAPTATTAPVSTGVPQPNSSATPVPQHSVQRIVIDTINLDETTVPVGLDKNRVPIVPQHEIGWYTQSAGPGQNENIVLWGHVLRFKATPNIPAPFQHLKELQPGDKITIYDEQNTPHIYAVAEQVQVTPDQVTYILPTGSEQLTLVSCIGDKVRTEVGVEMTHRLITIAKPVE